MKSGFVKILLRGLIGGSILGKPLIFARGPKGEQDRKTTVIAFINIKPRSLPLAVLIRRFTE